MIDVKKTDMASRHVVSNHYLDVVGDVGGNASDLLQVVHPLRLFGLFPIPVASSDRLYR
jgi:hypothetical protein